MIPKMLMLALAISCLTTSNLPWFLDLHSRFLWNIVLLQHQTLLRSPVTSTTGGCFCFYSVSLFFLELFLFQLHIEHLSAWGVHLSASFLFFFFIIVSFCLFILFMVFSRQEYWSGFPFPSPVDHVLSELFTMTCPCWVALHGMAYRFIELDKAVIHVISSVSFLWLWFSFCPLTKKDKRLMEASWWEKLTRGETVSDRWGLAQ